MASHQSSVTTKNVAPKEPGPSKSANLRTTKFFSLDKIFRF